MIWWTQGLPSCTRCIRSERLCPTYYEMHIHIFCVRRFSQRRHLGGLGGRRSPPRKKKKRKKKKEKKKKEKKEKKREKRKKGTMNNVKLLHIKCCFFQFFNSPVALKNLKKFCPPKKKLKSRPWFLSNLIID